MRLDMDCVRDILLCVEENTNTYHYCAFYDIGYHGNKSRENAGEYRYAEDVEDYQVKLLDKYGNDILMYHINYCEKDDLIVTEPSHSIAEIKVFDLTAKGHNFIANIRKQDIWDGVKDIAAKIGSDSPNAIAQIASSIIVELIKKQFNL